MDPNEDLESDDEILCNPELQDQLNNGITFKEYRLIKSKYTTQKYQSLTSIWEYWTKNINPSSPKLGLFPLINRQTNFEFPDAEYYPVLTKTRSYTIKQELQSLLLNHFDICLIDPFSNNQQLFIDTIYTYISNRLKSQFVLNKTVSLTQESTASNLPQCLQDTKTLGYTNCKILVLLCYKKEVKDFLINFFKCSQQNTSQMLLEKLDEKYDNEDNGLETDFQVGLRYNGKSFIVKKKISLADIIISSIDSILDMKGSSLSIY